MATDHEMFGPEWTRPEPSAPELPKRWYVVSNAPYRIEMPPGDYAEGGDPGHYQTANDAVDAIEQDHHGDAGTRYVLRVDVYPVATYSRAWTLRKD